MSFNFSKSKFVSSCTRCNKYTWLDKHKPGVKSEPDEFTASLLENGHIIGALAKEYFNIDADVTVLNEKGSPDLSAMLAETQKHISLGTRTIAEASFSYGGFFCSVDILVRNSDGSYNIYEVKSSKQDTSKNKKLGCVEEKYIIDASYQQYVLEKCGIRVDRVFVVMLADKYIRGKTLELDKYFVICDVTEFTSERQNMVSEKLTELGKVLAQENEPVVPFFKNCNGCDYWRYCSRNISSPSPFDVYFLPFGEKCRLYEEGVSFFDVPDNISKIRTAARRQIEYYNRPEDEYIDKTAIKQFLEGLEYPLYSLDFETYLAVVPEHEGIETYEQVPFQYSLHIVKKPDADISEGSGDIEEHHFLDLSGRDTRRDIAESLVENIPRGAQVMAYHESTERNIIARLAECYPELADHLLSFTYADPLNIFTEGYYYVKAMGKSFSLKSVSPALYPDDKDMNYRNLEGNVRNGVQAMNAYARINSFTQEEKNKIENDLEKYCALDTFAVVKILKKLYEKSI